jgi:hypothetical protein
VSQALVNGDGNDLVNACCCCCCKVAAVQANDITAMTSSTMIWDMSGEEEKVKQKQKKFGSVCLDLFVCIFFRQTFFFFAVSLIDWKENHHLYHMVKVE